jgi:hypothetical protein
VSYLPAESDTGMFGGNWNDAASIRRGDRDEVEAIEDFVRVHPQSAWKPALQVNLGAIYRRTGHFSKALETWQAAWDDSKGFTDLNGRAVGDIAAAYP